MNHDNRTSGGIDRHRPQLGRPRALRRGNLVGFVCLVLSLSAVSVAEDNYYSAGKHVTTAPSGNFNIQPQLVILQIYGEPSTWYRWQVGCNGAVVLGGYSGGMAFRTDENGEYNLVTGYGSNYVTIAGYTGNDSNNGPPGTELDPMPLTFFGRLKHYTTGAVLDEHTINGNIKFSYEYGGGSASHFNTSVAENRFTLGSSFDKIPGGERAPSGWEDYGDGPGDDLYPELEGKNLRVPFFYDGDEPGEIEFEIGGETHTIPVKPGLNVIDATIPAEWDGKFMLDGEEKELEGNCVNLGTAELPSWTFVPETTDDYGADHIIVTDPNTGQTHMLDGGGSTSSSSGSSVQVNGNSATPDKPDGSTTDAQASAALDNALMNYDSPFDLGDAIPESLGDDAAAVRDDWIDVAQEWSPLTAGGLPRAGSLAVAFPTSRGTLGGTVNFGESPFPQIRAGIMVMFGLLLTVAFFRKATI